MNEQWKWVAGFERKYAVSDLGRVMSFAFKSEGVLLTPDLSAKGYLRVGLTSNGVTVKYSIHRLVCQAFLDNPENKPTVNHINGVRHDNRLINLEWATHKENSIHGFSDGKVDFSGLKNNAANKKQFTFKHPNLGVFVGTVFEFYTTNGLKQSGASQLIHGRCKSYKGWTLENKEVN